MRLLAVLAVVLFAGVAQANETCTSRGCTSDREAPIIVEKVRVMPEDSITTRTDTVVRQGDRILLVVKGKQHSWDISDVEAPEYDGGR